MDLNIDIVREGLREEHRALPDWIQMTIKDINLIEGIIKLEIDSESLKGQSSFGRPVLDESLEGAKAWWPAPEKGQAFVLSVLPEEGIVLLSDWQGKLPSKGHWLRIYPQDFLKHLIEIWADPPKAKKAIAFQSTLKQSIQLEPWNITPSLFPHLRTAQKKAFTLLDHQASYLWGPPGTGKTTTLGCLLSSAIKEKPELKILLLATTNRAVDQALLAVDKAIDSLGPPHKILREKLCRIGRHFDAEAYEGRDHLIPLFDKEILHKIRNHARQKPDPDAKEELKIAWTRKLKNLEEQLAKQLKGIIHDRQLVAMTATKAAFDLSILESLPRFDLVVFDEASQLSLASVLPLLHLGGRCLFTGDPEQLSPIVVSHEINAQKALGHSPFNLIPIKNINPNTVFLNEQSRMADEICRAVSHLSYGGELTVAINEQSSESWLASRRLKFAELSDSEHLHIIEIAEAANYSRKYGGRIRLNSALRIQELIEKALIKAQAKPKDIIILTPFRAQRLLIKQVLYKNKIHGIKVSTVHSSQGSEAPVVIFDPVKADEKFLCDKGGKRLINVAISRAQAKLIILISTNDAANPYLNPIIQRKALQGLDTSSAVPLVELVKQRHPEPFYKDQLVEHAGDTGKIIRLSRELDRIEFQSFETGSIRAFKLSLIENLPPPP